MLFWVVGQIYLSWLLFGSFGPAEVASVLVASLSDFQTAGSGSYNLEVHS